MGLVREHIIATPNLPAANAIYHKIRDSNLRTPKPILEHCQQKPRKKSKLTKGRPVYHNRN